MDEKLALSSLVNKLYQYVFDVEQTAMKEDYDLDEIAHHDTEGIDYDEDDLNFKSPQRDYETKDDEYYSEGEGSPETLHLGNSRELEDRLKQYSELRDSANLIQSEYQQFTNQIKSPLSDNTSSANNYSEGSYSQKYLKKKKKK